MKRLIKLSYFCFLICSFSSQESLERALETITALKRTESRGSHFRSDYPNENNDAWVVNIQIQNSNTGLEADSKRQIFLESILEFCRYAMGGVDLLEYFGQ